VNRLRDRKTEDQSDLPQKKAAIKGGFFIACNSEN